MRGDAARTARGRRNREQGQILVLFVLGLVVILAVGALLLDGANSLVTRRRLQNVGDAAALAGANTIHAAGSAHVCSTVSSSPPGAPRADIIAAVNASIATNWPSFPSGNVTITCAQDTLYNNQAVKVDLTIAASNFLGTAIGYGGTTVATSSTALNGQIAGSTYSVVLLDPSNSSWPNQRKGCPSLLISGGPTLTFGGSIFVDSACTAANGGAIGTNGTSATVTFASGKGLYVVGGYTAGPLTITPAPITGATAIADPLLDLEPINYAAMTVRSASQLVLNNTTQVLQPGVYTGGVQLKNSSIALLRPGIYVFNGGGLDVGAQASVCSISATSIATNCSSFATECPDTACGVLLFNRGTASGGGAMGQITAGAGATIKLRAYDDRAMASVGFEYRNLLIWQSATPVPSNSYAQPIIQLNGGGTVEMSGTVYAPSAKVAMGGGSGGSGGSTNLTLQFIAWDLEMQGNSTFTFNYSDVDFARPKDYGLVQ
jgi:putative Flp pilus-assembly TadE/G-like protein